LRRSLGPPARAARRDEGGHRGGAAKLADVASIKNIERDIRALEGFSVVIRSDGTNRRNLPEYDYGRAARAPFTVADWKRRRIEPNYPGLDVDVLRADGRRATATMTLAKIRSDYD
jgi:hypothetical protein